MSRTETDGDTAVDAVDAEAPASAESPTPEPTVVDTEAADTEAADVAAGDTRLTPGRLAGIGAVLIGLAAVVAFGGIAGLRDHRAGQRIAAAELAAVAAAKECVVATQIPASTDMAVAEQKILDCSTGEFRTQALAQSGMFLRMYQVANVHVKLGEVRAAAESYNPDGSVDVLVAFRVQVDDPQSTGRIVGSRLRAEMAFDEGQYRIAKLDPVAK